MAGLRRNATAPASDGEGSVPEIWAKQMSPGPPSVARTPYSNLGSSGCCCQLRASQPLQSPQFKRSHGCFRDRLHRDRTFREETAACLQPFRRSVPTTVQPSAPADLPPPARRRAGPGEGERPVGSSGRRTSETSRTGARGERLVGSANESRSPSFLELASFKVLCTLHTSYSSSYIITLPIGTLVSTVSAPLSRPPTSHFFQPVDRRRPKETAFRRAAAWLGRGRCSERSERSAWLERQWCDGTRAPHGVTQKRTKPPFQRAKGPSDLMRKTFRGTKSLP